MNVSSIKKKLTKEIKFKLNKIKNIISITLVGSFVNQKDLSGISDIDTIVICKSINKKLFNKCLDLISSINLNDCGLQNYTLRINSTFGPLKFDEPNIVVVHLMIYDIHLHRKHVLASPFTCFDWERSKPIFGIKLKEIFPVGRLQLRDFIEVRRSMENYLQDLNNKVVSYREYSFHDGKVFEIKKNKSLDLRHRGEYAYHIIRNLTINYMKLCLIQNSTFNNKDVTKEISRLLSNYENDYTNFFLKLSEVKAKRANNFSTNSIKLAKSFLKDFQDSISNEWEDAVNVQFVRHYKTIYNDGTFLGQKRNPSIEETDKKKLHKKIGKLYSSPLKRCIQTADIMFTDTNVIKDKRLTEFDYGLAEGLTYEQLCIQYPSLIRAWNEGKDPKFPEGESTRDLNNRLKSFLKDLSKVIIPKKDDSIGVVTHNGILRSLLGSAFNLDIKEWYKIQIPHGLPLDFLYFKENFYPNIPRKLLKDIFINIGCSLE